MNIMFLLAMEEAAPLAGVGVVVTGAPLAGGTTGVTAAGGGVVAFGAGMAGGTAVGAGATVVTLGAGTGAAVVTLGAAGTGMAPGSAAGGAGGAVVTFGAGADGGCNVGEEVFASGGTTPGTVTLAGATEVTLGAGTGTGDGAIVVTFGVTPGTGAGAIVETFGADGTTVGLGTGTGAEVNTVAGGGTGAAVAPGCTGAGVVALGAAEEPGYTEACRRCPSCCLCFDFTLLIWFFTLLAMALDTITENKRRCKPQAVLFHLYISISCPHAYH